MNKRLKTIQIGVEHDHGGVTMASAKKLTEDFEIVAYADPHPEDIVRWDGDRRFIGDTPVLTVEQALNIEGLDCVSLGPDMFDIHTPLERLSISSTERVWNYLLKVLGSL